MQTVCVAPPSDINAPIAISDRQEAACAERNAWGTFQATQPKSAYRHLFMLHRIPPIALTETSPAGVLTAEARAARSP
jgi:hypothetical protein